VIGDQERQTETVWTCSMQRSCWLHQELVIWQRRQNYREKASKEDSTGWCQPGCEKFNLAIEVQTMKKNYGNNLARYW